MTKQIALVAIAVFLLVQESGPLDSYVRTLRSARAVSATLSVNEVGGSKMSETVDLAKPNRFRIDSDSELIVGDGKTVTRFSKARKSFVTKPQSDADIETLFDRPDLKIWKPFFNEGGFAGASLKDQGSRTLRGMTLTAIEASLSDDSRITFYLSPKDNLVHVAEVVAGPTTSILNVSAVSTGAADDAKFAWTPPAGARETTEAEALYDSKVDGQPIPDGTGVIQVRLSGLPLDVYTYRPPSYKQGLFIIVFHGLDRQPEVNVAAAKKLADRTGALLLAPDFDVPRFGDEGFQGGWVYKDKKLMPQGAWTFSRIPELIYLVRKLEGAPKMPVYLMGHSAGGQFVARIASLLDVGAVRYVAANPSAYVFPTTAAGYGYGLGGLPPRYSDDAALRRYLARPITVFVGTADTGTDNLDESTGAMQEGKNRYERARNFFEAGRALAAKMSCEFNWRLVEVPGVGHGARVMYESPQAMIALFGDAGHP